MYLVKLINEGIETVIHYIAPGNSPRIEGTIKHGINTIDSFTFSILPNNPGYNKIHALKTLVKVLNIKTNKLEFEGRILLPKHDMSGTGLLSKTVVCESELGYLMDTNQRYGEYHNVSVREFLEIMIDNHNRNTSTDKHFVVGKVDVVDNNDSLYRFLGYEKTLTSIKDKLIDRLGGELRIRKENGVRYLDYVQELGYNSPTNIQIAKNLETVSEEIDPGEVITKLVPLGAKLKKTTTDSDGNESESDTDERLTISSVNGGLDYIYDKEALALFGEIESTKTWDDVHYPDILLSKGQAFLKSNNKIKKKYSISALDLSSIGLDIDSIDIYNYYHLINPLMNIDENLRVIEKTIDINNPYKSSLSIGDKFEDIKQFQVSIKRTNDVVKEVNLKVNSTITSVAAIKDNVINLGDAIGDIDNALTGNIGNVEEMANLINTISNTVIQNTKDISQLQNDTNLISTGISSMKSSLDSIKADISTIKTDISTIKTKVNKVDTLDTKIDTILNLLQTS